MSRYLASPRCQFFVKGTSVCLRPYAGTVMSPTRGLVDLCSLHVDKQIKRDANLYTTQKHQD